MNPQMNSALPAANNFTRRQFLARSAVATAALCVGGAMLPRTAAAALGNRRLVPLDGKWQVAKAGTEDWIPATVPGCIHTDLLAAGKIPDPFYRDQEKAVQWVGEADWQFRRSFQMDAETLAHQQVRLRCEGLDTLATIKINGRTVGETDNMFRTWEYDVKPLLQPGENQIEILFSSAVVFTRNLEAKRQANRGVTGRAWLRKEPCQFGWDWAPTLVTSGIWKSISLEAIEVARLDDVLILQDHSAPNRVGLTVELTALAVETQPLRANVTVSYGDHPVAQTRLKLIAGEARCEFALKNPKLWWPAGLGEQPLYTVKVELLDADGNLLDGTSKRIGLRTLGLLHQDAEHPLRFMANGVEFFAKGANWIPSDAFSTRVTTERLRQYVAAAAAVNMNMLRFWGGGYYEEDALYDACDEMGICVWADFKFACASYPAFDAQFVDNVRHEARDNLRRLRHHPCIAVWCGNNEISLLVKDDWSMVSMGRDGYDYLFKQVLGDEVRTYSPQTSYVSGSPDCGDVHYWDVWWGARTFEAYRELSGFISEFGYQSYPEPRTVYSYTDADDRKSTMTDVMKWHQRAPQGNDRIKNMTGNYFRGGKDFDSTLWISQLVQSYGVKLGAEYWRQHMPKSMGCLFWQYNDCWPVASWSSVDYYGRWKALHYAARHFYAPVLVSGLEDIPRKTVDVFLTSDQTAAGQGTVEWNITDLQGTTLNSGQLDTAIPARKSEKIKTLDLEDLCRIHGQNNLMVWLKLTVAGRQVSQNLVTFGRPKDLNLADPQLASTVTQTRRGFQVKLTAEKPALWSWLDLSELDARYSDNFVHLNARDSFKFLVVPARPLSLAEFKAALTVRSLYDTYRQVG
jgi:beta-mannosidase